MVELRNANVFDYIRFVLSALILLFSAVVTTYAIVEEKTGFFKAVPGWAALILFVVDLFILGIVEGLQIALVELKRQHPDAYRHSHPGAYRLGQIAATGDNVERFLMGRQVFVVFLVFFAAKLTTILLDDGEAFLFPVPAWFRSVFLETGILACVVVVIIAQLMPQIVAAKYPVHFLQIFLMRPAYYICVFVEITGLTHICWVLSAAFSRIMGMHDDVFNVHHDKNAETVIKDIESSLGNISPETGSSPPEKQPHDGVMTTIQQEEYKRFCNLMDNITNQLDPSALLLVQHYLDRHPEKFHKFPSVVGGRMYLSPHAAAQELQKDGMATPAFLTDISDPSHVPPHIVASDLLVKNYALQKELDELKGAADGGNKTKL